MCMWRGWLIPTGPILGRWGVAKDVLGWSRKYAVVFHDGDIAGLSHIYCLNRIIVVISPRTVNKCESLFGELIQEVRAAMSELHSECFTVHVFFGSSFLRIFLSVYC